MKHTIKLLTLVAVLTAVFGLTGCPGPVNNYVEPTHEHVFGEWSEWEVVTTATCTEDGSKKRTRTCSCGEVEEETAVIPALGHNWVLDNDTATCTEDGKKIYHCSHDGCKETKEEDSPAHHHEDYETSGYCETCKTYKYEVNGDNPNGLEITAIIGTSEEDFNSVSDHWSIPKEKGNDYISLEDILHMKSKYKDCKVKCWKNGYVTFEESSDITERRIKNWSDVAYYVIIE